MKNTFYRLIPKTDFQISDIEKYYGKKLNYASMGRFGIYQILLDIKSELGESKDVMMPVYACSSIKWAIQKAGLNPIYYDIKDDDLNGDLNSIKKVQHLSGCKVLLIPSLYGNPSELVEIERYCREQGIYMIDDAAQAFGSEIDGRPVGTFGNAGLFSFSAGKPTFGHMGCFWWSQHVHQVKKKSKHSMFHRFQYINYFYNRYSDYNGKKLYRIKLWNYFMIFLHKLIDVSNDIIPGFERRILPQIAMINTKDWKKYRKTINERIRVMMTKTDRYRLIIGAEGANNNKIVLVAQSKEEAIRFIKLFKSKNCYASRGYRLLSDDKTLYPVAFGLEGRIIEIPILNEKDRMNEFIVVFEDCLLELS